MPNKPLPWFRFWGGATAHSKVRQLSDATFRTWVELLDAASVQPVRGRFESAKAAAAVTRRPLAHVIALVKERLLDDTEEGLVMHDWDSWQRWRPEDDGHAINTRSTPDGHAMDSRSTRDEHRNGSSSNTRRTRDQPASLRESTDLETDTDVERERRPETNTPSGAKAPSPPGERRHGLTVVDDAFRQSLEDEFWEAFGSRGAVRSVMDEAMSHTALKRRTDHQAYLRNWVRRDASRMGQSRNHRPAARATAFGNDVEDCPSCGKTNIVLAYHRCGPP